MVEIKGNTGMWKKRTEKNENKKKKKNIQTCKYANNITNTG